MKKSEQAEINRIVYEFEHYIQEKVKRLSCKNFRKSNAKVIEVQDKETGEVFYLLRSYSTIVAGVKDDIGYDFLREAYGYNATSAQHIAKFFRDYHAVKQFRFYFI